VITQEKVVRAYNTLRAIWGISLPTNGIERTNAHFWSLFIGGILSAIILLRIVGARWLWMALILLFLPAFAWLVRVVYWLIVNLHKWTKAYLLNIFTNLPKESDIKGKRKHEYLETPDDSRLLIIEEDDDDAEDEVVVKYTRIIN